MSSRIDPISRALTQFMGQDSAAKQVPVIADGENSFGSTLKRCSDSTEIGFNCPLLMNGSAAGSVLIT